MRFYTKQHNYYCGIDLHTKVMYLCIFNSKCEVVFHKNIKANPEDLSKAIAPYREDLVIGVECTFTWYWDGDMINIINNLKTCTFPDPATNWDVLVKKT